MFAKCQSLFRYWLKNKRVSQNFVGGNDYYGDNTDSSRVESADANR